MNPIINYSCLELAQLAATDKIVEPPNFTNTCKIRSAKAIITKAFTTTTVAVTLKNGSTTVGTLTFAAAAVGSKAAFVRSATAADANKEFVPGDNLTINVGATGNATLGSCDVLVEWEFHNMPVAY